MKRLLLLPIIFILVSCQPSELDRCIESNSNPVAYDLINKFEKIYPRFIKVRNKEYDSYDISAVVEFVKTLNELEVITHSCAIKSLNGKEYDLKDYVEAVDNCEVKNKEFIDLFSKQQIENKDLAIQVCNAQGIY